MLQNEPPKKERVGFSKVNSKRTKNLAQTSLAANSKKGLLNYIRKKIVVPELLLL